MTQIDSSAASRSSTPASRFSRWRKIAISVAAVVGAFLVLGMGLPWVWVYTPHWFWMRAGIVLLWSILGVCLIAAPSTAVGVVWSSLAVAQARRRRDRAGFLREQVGAALVQLPGFIDADGSGHELRGSSVVSNPRSGAETEQGA